jgi:hypothetical protein
MPTREQGAGPGRPGGPAPGGPDGRVQALLAEAALDHRQGLDGPTVPVDRGDQPGRPAGQPGLDLGGGEQGDRPRMVGRDGLVRGLGGEADGQVDQGGLRPSGGGRVAGVGGAHADVLCGGPGAWAAVRQRVDAGRRQGVAVGPGGRLASAGGRSRAPGPGTRAGPLQPRGEAGVAALGGVPVRHGKRGGCRRRRRLSSRQAGRTRLYRIATIPCCSGCQIDLVDWGVSAMVWPPLVPASP